MDESKIEFKFVFRGRGGVTNFFNTIFFFLKISLPKLAPEIIEPETLSRSTLSGLKPIPLGQPKWVSNTIFLEIVVELNITPQNRLVR